MQSSEAVTVSKEEILRFAATDQLYRGSKKVLSLWPAKALLKLKRTWTFEGKRFRLVQGVYRWYVFPGFGSRKLNKYGTMLGGATFRVTR